MSGDIHFLFISISKQFLVKVGLVGLANTHKISKNENPLVIKDFLRFKHYLVQKKRGTPKT